ncbi:MAG: hypothetical protein IJA67_10565 [Oscillospiraceae bacterium]|nr:hypothetical protein [Oscillospiraceae bacterium]
MAKCKFCGEPVVSGIVAHNECLPRWIPVTERKPKLLPCAAGTAYSEAVNVLTSGRKVLTAIWDGTDFIADAEFWEAENEEITHWTPVLMPPSGGVTMEIKLHKRVKFAGDVFDKLCELGWDIDTAAAFCDSIPDADIAERQWIPVTERLPTKEDADKHGGVWAIHKRFHSDAWNWETVRDYPEEFTHWMHLPAHPEVTV